MPIMSSLTSEINVSFVFISKRRFPVVEELSEFWIHIRVCVSDAVVEVHMSHLFLINLLSLLCQHSLHKTPHLSEVSKEVLSVISCIRFSTCSSCAFDSSVLPSPDTYSTEDWIKMTTTQQVQETHKEVFDCYAFKDCRNQMWVWKRSCKSSCGIC